MSWAVSSSAVKEPPAMESLMLALGKSLYLACEFERKCQYVLGIFRVVARFESSSDPKAAFAAAAAAKDRLLAKTIGGMAELGDGTPEEIDGLTKARIARNHIVHESGKLGSLRDLSTKHIAEALRALRPAVSDLARGDNIISVWDFEIHEKRAAPEWMTQTYEARVLSWIFGDPFLGVSSDDDWIRKHLAKRPR